ncbi:MAG: hypothetical protein AB7S78_02400 [Candidatus Omnitrophota bacterium]
MEKRIIKSAFYVGLGFIIAMGGAAATNKKLYYRSHGIKTMAAIVAKNKKLYAGDPALKTGNKSLEKDFILKLQFFDRNGYGYDVDVPVYHTTWKKVATSNSIEILYNPDDPGKNIIVTQDHRAVSIGLEIIFMLIGLFMVYFGLAIFDKKEWFWINKKKKI